MDAKEASYLTHSEHGLSAEVGLFSCSFPLEDLPDALTTYTQPAPDFGVAQSGLP